MKASALIDVLQKAIAIHGDLEVRGYWETISEPVRAVVVSPKASGPCCDGPTILLDVDSIGGAWGNVTTLFEDRDAQ